MVEGVNLGVGVGVLEGDLGDVLEGCDLTVIILSFFI